MRKTQTGGGVVVGPTNQVLVVSQHGLSWSLPKGHIDPGEDALAAAVREVKEESGINQLEMIKPLGTYQRHRIGLNTEEDDPTELKTINMYLFATNQTELAPEDPENPEARWVDVDSVAALLTHAKDKAFYESIIGEVTAFIAQKH